MRGRGLMGVPLLNVWRHQEQEGSSFVCVRVCNVDYSSAAVLLDLFDLWFNLCSL